MTIFDDFRNFIGDRFSWPIGEPKPAENEQDKIARSLFLLKRAIHRSDTRLSNRLINEIPFESLVGVDEKVQGIRSKFFPGSVSSDPYELVQDIMKELFRELKNCKNENQRADIIVSLLLKCQKIPNFPRAELEKLFLQIPQRNLIDKNGNNFLHHLMVNPTFYNNIDRAKETLHLFGKEIVQEWMNSPNQHGMTPIVLYCETETHSLSAEFISLFLDYGADPSLENNYGSILLHHIFSNIKKLKEGENISSLIELFNEEQFKEWINSSNHVANTPLMFLLKTDSKMDKKQETRMLQSVETMKARNYIKNLREPINRRGETPLEAYCKYSTYPNLNIIKSLVSRPITKKDLYILNKVFFSTPLIPALTLENKDTVLAWLKDLGIENHKTILKTIKLFKKNDDNVSDFLLFAMDKIPFFGLSTRADNELSGVIDLITLNPKYTQFFENIRMNHKLKFNVETLQRVYMCFSTPLAKKNKSAFFVALQTCSSLTELESHFLGHVTPAPTSGKNFASLEIEDQERALSSFILFRDREGLLAVSDLLRRSREGERIDASIIEKALGILKKAQIFQNPEIDESNLLHLIFSLWGATEGKNQQESAKLLASAVESLAEVDFIQLKGQYRSGIFEIFKSISNQLSENDPLLSSFVKALNFYSYDPSNQEDKEILDYLIKLQETTTSDEIKINTAQLLSSVAYEPGLLAAWKTVKSPTWDRYSTIEEDVSHVISGDFSLFNYIPAHLQNNRGVVKKRILDLLAVANHIEPEVDSAYNDYKADPKKYPQISRYANDLLALPPNLIRYFDPLYLPGNSFVFRGLSGDKGTNYAINGLIDLFERGAGSSELTNAKSKGGTWAKTGQIFCALDKEYALTFAPNYFATSPGAFMVIKGDYINKAIVRRGIRQQREVGSTHYVLYDTIGLENIEKIYIAPNIYKELTYLRDSTPETFKKEKLKVFKNLTQTQLERIIRTLKADPHQLFKKLASSTYYKNNKEVKEKDTDFKDVVDFNTKKEIARGLMEEKYSSDFPPTFKSRL